VTSEAKGVSRAKKAPLSPAKTAKTGGASKASTKRPAGRAVAVKSASGKKTTGKPASTTKRSAKKPAAAAKKPVTAKKPPTKQPAAKGATKSPTTRSPAKKTAVSKKASVSSGKRPRGKIPQERTASSPARSGVRPKSGVHKAPSGKVPFDAYKGTKPYIFISYSHKNMREVFGIIRKLNESRYRIWYDEGIEPGNEWPEVVGKALLGSTQFLVFMSRSAANSRNVRNEINLAFSEGKNIIVVYLEKTNLTEGMKLQIGTVQFINRFELGTKEFIDKLKSVLANEFHN
jgi:hypothetical protein